MCGPAYLMLSLRARNSRTLFIPGCVWVNGTECWNTAAQIAGRGLFVSHGKEAR